MTTKLAAHRSNSHEWYTPTRYVELARTVLDTIDLDPASSPAANETVRATTFYVEDQDGLSVPWSGRTWMNPPYGNIGPRFVTKLVDHYDAGDVEAAIVLLSLNAISTQWFRPLWRFPMCIPDHRIRFIRSDGLPGASPANGNVFVYLGRDIKKFVRTFRELGLTLTRLNP